MRFITAIGLIISTLLTTAYAETAIIYKKLTEANGARIYGIVQGKKHLIFPKANEEADLFIDIVKTQDFDGDGLSDALISESTGGNCCASMYKIASYQATKGFSVHDLTDAWDEPQISSRINPKTGKPQKIIKFISNNEGINTDDFQEERKSYVLENGKPILITTERDKELKALVEKRSNQLTEAETKQANFNVLSYDLDGDGKKDTINGSFWERWGRISFEINFANGTQVKNNNDLHCKRIGVLANKTNGVHDLVCDTATLFKWTGTTYVRGKN
jgi:hypothetical protein